MNGSSPDPSQFGPTLEKLIHRAQELAKRANDLPLTSIMKEIELKTSQVITLVPKNPHVDQSVELYTRVVQVCGQDEPDDEPWAWIEHFLFYPSASGEFPHRPSLRVKIAKELGHAFLHWKRPVQRLGRGVCKYSVEEECEAYLFGIIVFLLRGAPVKRDRYDVHIALQAIHEAIKTQQVGLQDPAVFDEIVNSLPEDPLAGEIAITDELKGALLKLAQYIADHLDGD